MSFSSIRSLTATQIMLYASGVLFFFAGISMLLIATQLNHAWMVNIHANSLVPDWTWAFFNVFGDAWVVLLVLLLSERRPGAVSSWAFKSWILGAVLVQLIKHSLQMPRPASVIELSQLSLIDHPPLIGASMPSGHAFAAISCALIFCVVMQSKRVSRIYMAPVVLLALLASWSRVAVGAHWPADVFAAIGLASFVVGLAFVWEQKKPWANFLSQTKGQYLLILIHVLIAIHLLTLHSDFVIARYFQFVLAVLSVLKAIDLIQARTNFDLTWWKHKS